MEEKLYYVTIMPVVRGEPRNISLFSELTSLKKEPNESVTDYIIRTKSNVNITKKCLVQSAGAVEYTDCFSVEWYPRNECPGYDTKQSDGEVPAMLELWGMQSTPLLPSLPGPLRPRVVAPGRARSMG